MTRPWTTLRRAVPTLALAALLAPAATAQGDFPFGRELLLTQLEGCTGLLQFLLAGTKR